LFTSSSLYPTIVIVAKPDGSAVTRAIQILRECRYPLVDLSDDVSSQNSSDDKFPQWLIVEYYDGTKIKVEIFVPKHLRVVWHFMGGSD